MEIQGHPNYLIYPDGRVFSKERLSKIGRTLKGKFLKGIDNGHGYKTIRLRNDDGIEGLKIHRLVAIHYIPNPDNKIEVDHKNRIRDDNRVENLRWVTRSENSQNKIEQSNNKVGHKNISYCNERKKYVYQKIINGEKIRQKRFNTIEEALVYKFFYLLATK